MVDAKRQEATERMMGASVGGLIFNFTLMASVFWLLNRNLTEAVTLGLASCVGVSLAYHIARRRWR